MTFKGKMKLGIVVCVVLAYCLLALPLYPFVKIFPAAGKKAMTFIKKRATGFVCLVLGIDLTVLGDRSLLDSRNTLIVCNHMSYLDIMILSSIMKTNYITSKEVREIPFFGLICELTGCVFVERRKEIRTPEIRQKELKDIRRFLQAGGSITLFPEATSTNGEELLSFKKPMYGPGLDANSDLLVLCLNYTHVDGEAFSRENRDDVCWYGDMDLISHIKRLADRGRIRAEVEIIERASMNRFQSETEAADYSYQVIQSRFKPIGDATQSATSSTQNIGAYALSKA